MQPLKSAPLPILSDLQLIGERLPVAGRRLLGLGCGRALTTLKIAEEPPVHEVIATEVDRVQHEKNLRIPDLPKVTFRLGGIEAIDEADGSDLDPRAAMLPRQPQDDPAHALCSPVPCTSSESVV